MRVWVEVKPYRRKFLQPLRTAHGLWQWRQGLLIRFTDEAGRMGLGEVAPIPWFGTETMDTAQQFWQGKIGWLDDGDFLAVPDALPATQFGTGAALVGLRAAQTERGTRRIPPLDHNVICGLLPAGEKALEILPDLLARQHRTFKWKVGVFPMAEELAWLEVLVGKLPADCGLRLDANGGLTVRAAEDWLARCDSLRPVFDPCINATPTTCDIEYLEQPLPPEQFDEMRRLSRQFETPIALDESAATLEQMKTCDVKGWSGLFVIKPTTAGYPHYLQSFLNKVSPRVIFSSGFETVIGRQAALALALEYYQNVFPEGSFPVLGFGTQHYFDDDWDCLNQEQLWERI